MIKPKKKSLICRRDHTYLADWLWVDLGSSSTSLGVFTMVASLEALVGRHEVNIGDEDHKIQGHSHRVLFDFLVWVFSGWASLVGSSLSASGALLRVFLAIAWGSKERIVWYEIAVSVRILYVWLEDTATRAYCLNTTFGKSSDAHLT